MAGLINFITVSVNIPPSIKQYWSRQVVIYPVYFLQHYNKGVIVMNKKAVTGISAIQCNPIGYVKSSMESFNFSLELDEKARPGLKHLDRFSHCLVLWWGHESDSEEKRSDLQAQLPYAEDVTAGVFACRAEYRPNPILVTTCRMLGVDEKSGTVKLEYIDAIDGSAVLDIKPYLPVSDRVKNVEVPEWYSDWPDWYEDAGEFFSKMFAGQ
jgi:tRNA (Thr-GGU) A37 N-methylase